MEIKPYIYGQLFCPGCQDNSMGKINIFINILGHIHMQKIKLDPGLTPYVKIDLNVRAKAIN
jgi:hypothetical protein